MLIKAKCEHCQSVFDDDGLERTRCCPACGQETRILPVRSRYVAIRRSVKTSEFDGLIMWSYLSAVLLPFVGFFIGLYLVLKAQHGHGVAAMALSFFSSAIWLVVFLHIF
jgi:hypothetical protein